MRKEIDNQIMDDMGPAVRPRAPIKWAGGKGILAPKITCCIPESKIYVEPFSGAASVFWHLNPRKVEVLNDLDGDIVNLWRVLQDKDHFDELAHRLVWTPYSRAEFEKALACDSEDPVDQAWAFFVRQNQGFSGKKPTSSGEWSRAFVRTCGMAGNASRWQKKLSLLKNFHDRLMRVQIDNIDAIKCINYWDKIDTVFYVDPPYVLSTRRTKKFYAVELDDDYHSRLIDCLIDCVGSIVLSGYESGIYDKLLDFGFDKITFNVADSISNRNGKGTASRRTECLWVRVNEKHKVKKANGLF